MGGELSPGGEGSGENPACSPCCLEGEGHGGHKQQPQSSSEPWIPQDLRGWRVEWLHLYSTKAKLKLQIYRD